jgi:HEAT repeat protein
MSMGRNILSDLLLARKYREAMDLIKKRHSRLRILLGLLYSEEELVRWRAVTLLGLIAADGETDLAPSVKKLLWFLNEESSTIGWCSAQAIAEIYRNNPGMARDAIRVVLHLSDDPELSEPANRNTPILAGSIWAIGILAEVEPALVSEMGPALMEFLKDPDPSVRGFSAWALGRMGFLEAEERLMALAGDDSLINLYEDDSLKNITVARAAEDALENIQKKRRMKEVKNSPVRH